METVTEFIAQQPYMVLGLAAIALTTIACVTGRSAKDIPAAVPKKKKEDGKVRNSCPITSCLE